MPCVNFYHILIRCFFKIYNASTSLTEKNNYLKVKGEKLSKNYTKQIEGIESLVKYRGRLSMVLEGIVANIRSGLSYSGARNIKEFWRKAQFIRITPLGKSENGAHNVILAS